uniref:Uncharacterized protein n=1 Tax=Tetradesmus obliquus TaxID=3088 RepID=A0A383W1H7_TETOB
MLCHQTAAVAVHRGMDVFWYTELYALGAIAEAPAPHLPVTAASHAVAGTPAAAAAGSGVDDAEQEVLSQEFRGLQLRHHMTPEELAQHRRQPGA